MKYTKHNNTVTAHYAGHKVTGYSVSEVNRKIFELLGWIK